MSKAKPVKSKDHMVWIDLEMTGLDPEKEVIIEIATLVTDKDLNIIAEGPNLAVKQSARLLKGMDEWNRNQHGKSGLTEAVRKSKITVRQAEEKTLRFVRRYCLPGKSVLCGNSVHHDRRFLIKYMPRLSGFLHYRLVDVSTIKYLVAQWYPKSKKNIPQKNETHRALDDIRDSVAELRFYRDNFFIPSNA